MDTSSWTKDDYKGFVLLYAASIDATVQEDELEMIVKVLGAERTKKLQKESAKLSDYESLQIIEDKRAEFYPGEHGKTQLLEEIVALFKVDGEYSQFEQVIARNLERVL